MSTLTPQHSLQTLSNPTITAIWEIIDRDVYLRSAHTKRAYKGDLKQFETWRSGRTLSKVLVEDWISSLQSNVQPRTINRKLTSVRWWASKLVDMVGDIPAVDPQAVAHRAELIFQLQRIAKVRDVAIDKATQGGGAGQLLSAGETVRLLMTCVNDPTTAGARDAAMVALAAKLGIRQGALAALTMESIKFVGAGGDLAMEIQFKAKGNKTRSASIDSGVVRYMRDWLLLRGDAPGVLFCRVNKSGVVNVAGGLSSTSMGKVLDKRLKQAGLFDQANKIRWHDFRRTLVSSMLDMGTDLATVSNAVGHSNVNTTAMYDRRGDHAKNKALQNVVIPYYPRSIV